MHKALSMKILIFIILMLISVRTASSDIIRENLIEKAHDAIKSNRPSEALKIFSQYQPKDGELYQYHYLYAKALEISKRRYESLAHFRLAYIYAPTEEFRELTLLERAEAYLNMEYFFESALFFKLFLKHFPKSDNVIKAHLGLAESFYRTKQFNEALKHYEKAGNSSAALYGKANVLQSLGMTRDANKLYLDLISKDKKYLTTSDETTYNIGENFRQMGNYADARIYLNSIKDLRFKQWAALSLGLIAIAENRLDSAIKFFNTSLQSFDKQLQRKALLYLADAHIKTGKEDIAKSKLFQIRDKHPYSKEHDDALLMLAQVFKKEGKLKESIALLKQLVMRKIPNKNALDEIESIILATKDRDEGEFLNLWRSVGHWLMEPARINSLLNIADDLRADGKHYLNLYKWLLKNGSENVKNESRLALAGFYADLGDNESAKRYLQGMTMKGDDEILRIHAKMYFSDNELQKAFETTMLIKNKKEEDMLLIANTIRTANDIKAAVDLFEKALNRFGGPPEAHIRLADILYDIGRRSDALKHYKMISIRKQHQKEDFKTTLDDIEWVNYRISRLSGNSKETTETLMELKDGKSILSRFAEADIKGINIIKRADRIF